ncbi:hypothetical protein L1987_45255 [Smallanthus sonchifolius]|uniref:Uncharacterized protein n=1 Tax=Smallanthus sonchifolius TaxID=185202 RepID=A0ACB9GT19_9ASTR|nr:hypothetical protein L1987_45255 [Smallanthus sonchifolius]
MDALRTNAQTMKAMQRAKYGLNEALSTPIGVAADSYECPTTGWVTNEKNEDELGIASFIDDEDDFTDSAYPNLAMQWK